MQRQADEESPLVGSQQKPKRTPLPWAQFSIVLFLQLAEPLTSQVIYPFTPELVRSLGVTNGDESKVGYYVGLLQSLFFLTQAMTVLHWSRLSDRIGRKPVILTGLAGLSISMYCFGLSRTFWGLVLSRCLNGALNGNIGVIKSIMAEMTDSTNISQAYAFQPIAWSTGSTLGPMIGGALARPAERFPHLFGNFEFLKKYPYFLPCAIPATFTILAWAITFFFLKETLATPLPVRQLFRRSPSSESVSESAAIRAKAIPDSEKPVPLRGLLVPRVILAGLNYACLALVDIAYRAIRPLFLSTPIAYGGLGLAPPEIGRILSIFGITNGICQVCFFANIHDYLGSKKTFTVGIASALPLFVLFPIINAIARAEGITLAVWALVFTQIVISVCLSFSYGAIFIYITGASPNRASLGATNGLCQMSVSIFRAVGPAAANSLFSLSIAHEYLGGWMVYYVLLAVTGVSLFVASLLPSQVWTQGM